MKKILKVKRCMFLLKNQTFTIKNEKTWKIQ